MHPEQSEIMRAIVSSLKEYSPFRVLDVGSYDVNGNHRDQFDYPVEYVGLDVIPGPNVDLVVKDPYVWTEITDGSFDVVISGSTFEHIEFPWLTIREIARVLRPGGLAFIIAPSCGPMHRYPVDCYRFFPDGLVALAKWGGLQVVAVESIGKGEFNDTFAHLRKPHET